MKYVIYCRKSSESEDKQALSIDSQESEMLQIAQKLNLSVVMILKESKSAKQPDRPVFNQMIKMIESGKADGILCWKLDRLARNPIDSGKISWLLQKELLTNIKTFDRDYYPTDNVLMMSVEFGMSNQYIRDLSANVKRGNRTKLERGEYPNRPPVGYLNDKLNKKIIIDIERSKYIIRAFELYSTGGYGFEDISTILFNEGFLSRTGKLFRKANIQYILREPFYYGVMEWKEKLYQGNHTPLISKTLFDKVQEVTEKRKHPHANKLFFPLRGFVLCHDCGCMYTASLKKGNDYYYCTNGKGACLAHKKYMREKELYKKILPILETLKFDPEIIDIIYESAKEQSLVDNSYFNETLTNLNITLKSLQERESKLLDAFLDSSINKETHDKKSLEISNAIFQIKQSIKEIEDKKEKIFSTLEPTRKLFLDCIHWANDFLEIKPEKKHDVIKKVLWNFSMKDDNIFNYQLKSPYDTISKAPKNGDLVTLRGVLDEVRTYLMTNSISKFGIVNTW
jgi:DNA invertase Pin-like site-specific DNA recombinase